MGQCGTARGALRPTQRPRRPSVVRPAPHPPPNRRAQCRHAARRGNLILATSPSTCTPVSARSGVHDMQRRCGVVPSQDEKRRWSRPSLSRRAPRCRARRGSRRQPKAATGLARCADIWIGNIDAARRCARRVRTKGQGVSSPAATTFPQTVRQGGGVHRAQGDRDSTMSGSVEATTAIALMMMSSGTPASRMAATRWRATAARSS